MLLLEEKLFLLVFEQVLSMVLGVEFVVVLLFVDHGEMCTNPWQAGVRAVFDTGNVTFELRW